VQKPVQSIHQIAVDWAHSYRQLRITLNYRCICFAFNIKRKFISPKDRQDWLNVRLININCSFHVIKWAKTYKLIHEWSYLGKVYIHYGVNYKCQLKRFILIHVIFLGKIEVVYTS